MRLRLSLSVPLFSPFGFRRARLNDCANLSYIMYNKEEASRWQRNKVVLIQAGGAQTDFCRGFLLTPSASRRSAMSLFLILMIAGLFGMALMAIPALGRHGHGMGGHGQLPHAAHLPLAPGHAASLARAGAHASGVQGTAAGGGNALSRFVPSPRIVFSILAAYGAFGYALVDFFHVSASLSYVLALIPAVLLERLALTPLWNLLLGFQGKPCTPIEHLVMSEAEAVTPFRNGKGIVRVVRDGRDVQFSAHLPQSQAAIPVRVGDKMRIEEVEPDGEHLKVTLG